MVTFADRTGREWTVALSVGHLADLRAVGFLIDDYVRSGDGPDKLLELPPRVLGSALWVLCGPQAVAAGVSPQTFGAELANDVSAAAEALAAAVVEFMPTFQDYFGLAIESVEGLTPEDLGLDLERECWEMAGVVGIDPRPFTYRQLFRMHKGRSRLLWDQTAAAMSLFASRTHPVSDAIDPARLNPYRSTKPLPTAEQNERDQRDFFRRVEAGLKNMAEG